MTRPDTLPLRELVDAYALGVDRRDSDAVAALFTPDGELALYMDAPGDRRTGLRRGRAEIAAAVSGIDRYLATHHTVSSTRSEIDGDSAAGESRCEAHHVAAGRDRVLYLHYLDRYERYDGQWRFSRREVHVRWVTILVVEP